MDNRPASVAQVTETQCVPTVFQKLGSIPGQPVDFVIPGAHALRLISQAGKRV